MNNYYALDNMGKFYSCISTKKHQTVFCYSCELYENVDDKILLEAFKETINTYPYFYVQLKRGLFWYYLEESLKEVKVYKESRRVCERIYKNEDDILVNVTYYKNRINFNVSHIISDGLGSLEFFKTLITNYISIKHNIKVKEKKLPSEYEKTEDAYLKYFKRGIKDNLKHGSIYRYKGKKYKDATRFIEARLSAKAILNEAHKYDTTLTIYLLSLFIYSHLSHMKEIDLKKEIKIDLPVNLRSYFKTNTNKNFFGLTYINYKFNSKNDTLEDIIPEVKKQLDNKLKDEYLLARASKMVALQKLYSARLLPLSIKNLGLRIIERYTRTLSTSSLSNVGKFVVDKNIEKHISNVNVLASTDKYQITIISIKDTLSIGIANIFKQNEVIKEFVRNLAKITEVVVNANEVPKDEM